MGDSKVHELMSKLNGGGTVSLESLEELLHQIPQGNDGQVHRSQFSESNSCGSSEVLNDDSVLCTSSENANNVSNVDQAIAITNGGSLRGTNFLELANTVSTVI